MIQNKTVVHDIFSYLIKVLSNDNNLHVKIFKVPGFSGFYSDFCSKPQVYWQLCKNLLTKAKVCK